MNDEKFLTVIIPMYNAIDTIATTLNSLLRQNNKNFEIIVINDGSTDGCDLIVDDFIKENENAFLSFKQITTINMGVSNARNIGIKHATGTNLIFLDADDMLSEITIDVVYKCLHNYNQMFFLWTRNLKQMCRTYDVIKEEKTDADEVGRIFAYKKYNTSFFNFVFDRTIIEKYNLQFNVDYKYGEDNLFFWSYISKCYGKKEKFCFVKNNLYFYYNNKKSCMKKMSLRQQDAISAIKDARLFFANYKDTIRFLDDYVIPKTVMSVLKNYAFGGEYKMFLECSKEQDAKKNAWKILMYGEPKWKIMSFFFVLNKYLFYRISRFVSFIEHRRNMYV